jgi:hypothetical protein
MELTVVIGFGVAVMAVAVLVVVFWRERGQRRVKTQRRQNEPRQSWSSSMDASFIMPPDDNAENEATMFLELPREPPPPPIKAEQTGLIDPAYVNWLREQSVHDARGGDEGRALQSLVDDKRSTSIEKAEPVRATAHSPGG